MAALIALTVQGVRAQNARGVLQAVAQYIGADNLKTQQISAKIRMERCPIQPSYLREVATVLVTVGGI